MSNRMRFALDQLNPQMREQAARKIGAQYGHAEVREHVCQDDLHDGGWKTKRAKAAAADRGLIPKLTDPEEKLAFHLKAEGLGHFKRQHRWHPERKFRGDFAFVAEKLLIEVQGGVYANGAHTRGAGYEYDRMRQNEAVILGWRVLEFSPKHVNRGEAVRMVKRALGR